MNESITSRAKNITNPLQLPLEDKGESKTCSFPFCFSRGRLGWGGLELELELFLVSL
jgi:hypothetical protein